MKRLANPSEMRSMEDAIFAEFPEVEFPEGFHPTHEQISGVNTFQLKVTCTIKGIVHDVTLVRGFLNAEPK